MGLRALSPAEMRRADAVGATGCILPGVPRHRKGNLVAIQEDMFLDSRRQHVAGIRP